MKRVCEKAEARLEIGDRLFVTDDVEVEGPGRIHYGRLRQGRFITWTRPQLNLKKYLEQNRTFCGRTLRVHDKGKDDRFHWRILCKRAGMGAKRGSEGLGRFCGGEVVP